MESRVLNRVSAVQTKRSRRWMGSFGAGAVAAALAVAGFFLAPRGEVELPRPPRPPGVALIPRAAVTVPPKIRVPAASRGAESASLGLSAGERALLEFGRRNPEELSRAFQDLEKQAAEPVAIPAIQIAPLDENWAK